MRRIDIVGGGTVQHVASHLALSAIAYGTTARQIKTILQRSSVLENRWRNHESFLSLTTMAGGDPNLETHQDLHILANQIILRPESHVVFWNPAIVDFDGRVGSLDGGKYGTRLSSSKEYDIHLTPLPKILPRFREDRKDLFIVGFKTTCGATEEEMYSRGLRQLKISHVNLCLVNDVRTRVNMVVAPEEAAYHVTDDRTDALLGLVDMTWYRSQLTYTRSVLHDGDPVGWSNEDVPDSFKAVINYCIKGGAYKVFNGITAGHFGHKRPSVDNLPDVVISSRRRDNHNDIHKNGFVAYGERQNENLVDSMGGRPSVGAQSQRIVFEEHPDIDCIVHFHCPLREGSQVPIASQYEYECGSHQCAQNTSSNMMQFGRVKAVMLDNHGPNIAFHHSIDSQEVIDFIEANFILSEKTGGYVPHL